MLLFSTILEINDYMTKDAFIELVLMKNRLILGNLQVD